MYVYIVIFTYIYIYTYKSTQQLVHVLYLANAMNHRKRKQTSRGPSGGGPLAARKSLFQAHLAKVHSMKEAIRGGRDFAGKRDLKVYLPNNAPHWSNIFSLSFFLGFRNAT